MYLKIFQTRLRPLRRIALIPTQCSTIVKKSALGFLIGYLQIDVFVFFVGGGGDYYGKAAVVVGLSMC